MHAQNKPSKGAMMNVCLFLGLLGWLQTTMNKCKLRWPEIKIFLKIQLSLTKCINLLQIFLSNKTQTKKLF
jgi:hypothetical protein